MSKSVTNVRQIRRESAAKKPQIRRKKAAEAENNNKSAASLPQIRHAFVPLLQRFRSNLKKNFDKNTAQMWIPIECSLLIRYEFAALSPQTRYIFVAILLYCGMRGTDEIPLDTKFMSSALIVDERTLSKSFDELLSSKLLVERKKEKKEEIEKTDTQTEKNGAVCVDISNSFSEVNPGEEKTTENENGLSDENTVAGNSDAGNSDTNDSAANNSAANNSDAGNSVAGNSAANNSAKKNLSRFSIDECLKYVELCKADGEAVQSPKALATHLFKTGEADTFIFARLFPNEAKLAAAESFGEPVKFSDQPCAVCFGAKMADTDGNGFRACRHCVNERGKATGREPEGAKTDE